MHGAETISEIRVLASGLFAVGTRRYPEARVLNSGNDALDGRTNAQAPQALAPRPPALGAPAPPAESESSSGLAQGLDHSKASRMRGFHAFGIGVSAVALLVAFVLGGDPTARVAFQLGMAWLGVSNVVTMLLARTRHAFGSRVMTVHFAAAGLGLVPALYYFGPFSAVTLAYPLALMFVALDRDRTTANVVVALALAEHLVVAVPIIVGWTTDVGLASITSLDRGQLVVIEGLILVLMASGHALGRLARRTSTAALAELASARRIIGDQRQVIVEAQDRVDQVNRMKRGRWTGEAVGRWRLGQVLGRGAMGEVYEAEDQTGRQAAVKVLASGAEDSSSSVERFERELHIAARLDSPHIVRVLDVSSVSAPVRYLAMERLRGEDLATRLRSETRMALGDVVGMLDQVARGLEIAHGAGVVHRDLKPHNLFLHDGTCWKILDFGVAKVFGVEGTLTQNGMVGTPQYMAPEQATGDAVTHLSDIYALGAIAYRCLTGRVPHGAKDFTALIYQVVRGYPLRPGTLARIPQGVEDVLAVAMAKDPRKRFTSALEFVDRLGTAAQGLSVEVEAPPDAWA